MKKYKGDVAWYLKGKKQPFAYSTHATSDLIAVLYEDYGDIRAVYDNITYDEDAKQICKTYIDNGEYTPNITY